MPDVAQMTRDEFANYVANVPVGYYNGEALNREGVAIHHTTDEVFGLEGAIAVMNYHLSIGWSDCGYHVIIDPDGTLYVYRMRPMDRRGSHIGDPWNQTYVGVSAQGNYCNRYPTAAFLDTLAFVIRTIGARYQTGNNYIRHCEVDSTACPGYNLTREIIDQALVGNTGYQPPVIDPPATTPPSDLTFPVRPEAPGVDAVGNFTGFVFIKGSGECLGNGDESPQVRDLEMCLYYLGYITYPPNTYVYDSYTEAGVKAFQTNFVPPADGIYGLQTARALQKEVARKWAGHPVDTVPTPPNVPPVVIEPPVVPPPVIPPADDIPGWFRRFIQKLIDFLMFWK